MIELIVFYFFVALTVLPVIFIVLSKQILYIAFALMLCFFGVAGLYVFAGAPFIAVTQVMIYLGGILVLLLFGIMFTKRGGTRLLISENRNTTIGALLALTIFLGMAWVFWNSKIPVLPNGTNTEIADTEHIKTLGISLMTDHVVAFEVAGVLLLVALIGAAFIAGKKTTPVKNEG